MSTKKLKQKRNTSVVLSKTNDLGNQRKSYLRHDSHIITSTNSLRTSSLNNQTSSSSSSSSLNNRKEYESFLRRYKIAMDQLTVDKLINHTPIYLPIWPEGAEGEKYDIDQLNVDEVKEIIDNTERYS